MCLAIPVVRGRTEQRAKPQYRTDQTVWRTFMNGEDSRWCQGGARDMKHSQLAHGITIYHLYVNHQIGMCKCCTNQHVRVMLCHTVL